MNTGYGMTSFQGHEVTFPSRRGPVVGVSSKRVPLRVTLDDEAVEERPRRHLPKLVSGNYEAAAGMKRRMRRWDRHG
jgi:hypothetical protein